MFHKLFRKEFSIGDVVVVKNLANSPKMIVIDNSSGSVRCMYFNDVSGVFNYSAFNPDILEIAKPTNPKVS